MAGRNANVHVTGVEGVVKALESMGERALVGGRKAVATTAVKVQKRAKVNATDRPGPRVKSGRLRSSIRIRFYEGGLAADVFTDVFYAPYLEFGWEDRYGNRHGPYPFLFPAWEAEKGALQAALGRML